MRRKTLIALLGATIAAAAASGAALAAGSGPAVSIRVEGLHRTLLLPTAVHGRSGWITKYKAPRGKCPGDTAQGALDVATHGRWRGQWYGTFDEYFITSILGEKSTGQNYWTIFVNDRPASAGACQIKLRSGQRLLFAVTKGKEYPAELNAPHSAVAGQTFKVKLVGFNAAGRSSPLRDVKITGNSIDSVRTNRFGVARVRDDHTGVLTLHAAPRGYIRTESIVRVAR